MTFQPAEVNVWDDWRLVPDGPDLWGPTLYPSDVHDIIDGSRRFIGWTHTRVEQIVELRRVKQLELDLLLAFVIDFGELNVEQNAFLTCARNQLFNCSSCITVCKEVDRLAVQLPTNPSIFKRLEALLPCCFPGVVYTFRRKHFEFIHHRSQHVAQYGTPPPLRPDLPASPQRPSPPRRRERSQSAPRGQGQRDRSKSAVRNPGQQYPGPPRGVTYAQVQNFSGRNVNCGGQQQVRGREPQRSAPAARRADDQPAAGQRKGDNKRSHSHSSRSRSARRGKESQFDTRAQPTDEETQLNLDSTLDALIQQRGKQQVAAGVAAAAVAPARDPSAPRGAPSPRRARRAEPDQAAATPVLRGQLVGPLPYQYLPSLVPRLSPQLFDLPYASHEARAILGWFCEVQLAVTVAQPPDGLRGVLLKQFLETQTNLLDVTVEFGALFRQFHSLANSIHLTGAAWRWVQAVSPETLDAIAETYNRMVRA